MSYTLFISDLHLDNTRPAVTRAFLAFLKKHSGCAALYILGDLFEAWVGDDDNAPLANTIRAALKDFSAGGARLYLMHGNRDFLLGNAFCADTDATLLADPSVIDLYGTPTALLHGDSLCTTDLEYQDFRRQARDPQWQAALLARSIDERRAFASELRGQSMEANANKPEAIMDVTPTQVDAVMQELGVTRLIHGHTHRPERHKVAAGERIVLGDWESHGWAIRADDTAINLYNFNINQQVKGIS